MMVHKVSIGDSSSRVSDVVDLNSSTAPLPAAPFDALATTVGTIDVSSSRTTRATNEESGSRFEIPYTDTE